jgi:ATP-dependent exoDNAse (exonuclease V) beta subunit
MVPQSWALRDEEKLMQQRNVAYVGMTRAMHQLTIVYNGHKSKFVDEMDSSLYTARTFADAVEVELKKPTPEYVKRELPKEEQGAKPVKTEPAQESRRKRWSFS